MDKISVQRCLAFGLGAGALLVTMIAGAAIAQPVVATLTMTG